MCWLFTFYPLTESVELLHGAAVTLLTLVHCILFLGCHREGLLQGQHDFIHLQEKNLFHHAVFQQLVRVYPNLYQTTVLVYLLKTLQSRLHPVLYFDVIKSGQHKGNMYMCCIQCGILCLLPVIHQCTGRHSKQSGSSLPPLSPCK